MGLKDGGGTMTMPDTEDYIVFDRTGTPHVVVAVKTEIGGNSQQSGNREVDALMSEDRLPCWHCRGIEAHKIVYVTAVKDKSGRMLNTPVDTPYNYCPACGRKLGVEG